MDIRFVTKNTHKFKEAKELLSSKHINILHLEQNDLYEIQAKDVETIINDKVIKAFEKVGRPLFVEHTSLFIDSINGFPGGVTQIFWDTLQADKVTEIFGKLNEVSVLAKTIIAYCDGKKIKLFEGESTGVIPKEPRGDRGFQWDCVFIPCNGNTNKTYAEMGMDRKNKISMRKLAFDGFHQFLLKSNGVI